MTVLKEISKLQWDDIDEDVKWILGRPNFQCGPISRRLREIGYKCDKKAENEQALVIHTLLKFYYEYGDSWRNEFEKFLKD